MPVNTIKFSQFATVDLTKANNIVGYGNGVNFQGSKIVTWTTAARPSPPTAGVIGFNSSFNVYEYWNGTIWVSIGSGTGSVTSVATGNGLTGGPITSTGTISLVAPVSVANGGTGLITTANNAGFFTNGLGVPGWVVATGYGPPVLQTGAIINAPIILTGLYDTNNNPFIVPVPTLNAVNYLHVANNSTGNPVQIAAAGSDANVALQVLGKGTGGVQEQGISNGSSYPSGFKGEIISSQVLFASRVSLTSGTIADITTVTITPGLWMCFGNVSFVGASVTSGTAWISSSSATGPDTSLANQVSPLATSLALGIQVPFIMFNVTTDTAIYLSCLATGTSLTGCGGIFAVRL